MIIWDEDPELSVVAESRYFIAFSPTDSGQKLPHSESFPISGRYAIFSAEVFTGYHYDLWHELAHLILDFDQKGFRDAPDIDWLNPRNHDGYHVFPPKKIGIPILS